MSKHIFEKGWWLFLPVWMWVLHYAAAPYGDFVSDDWAYVQWGQEASGYGDIWRSALLEPDRPFYAGVAISLFRMMGDIPTAFFVYGWFLNAGILLLYAWVVLRLSGSKATAFLSAILLSSLPILTESFHWPIVLAFSHVQLLYLGSLGLAILYADNRKYPCMLGSAVLYLVALGTYEVGFALPAVVLVVWWFRNKSVSWSGLLLYAAMFGLYVAWRYTDGFGFGQRKLYPAQNVALDLSIGHLFWNVKELVRWWAGGHCFAAVVNGLQGWLDAGRWGQRILITANIGLLILFARFDAALRRHYEALQREGVAGMRALIIIGVVWAVTGLIPSLIHYSAARVMFYPAMGVALCLAALLVRLPFRQAICFMLPMLLFLMMSAQGTSVQWKKSGIFNRGLYEYLHHSKDEWENKAILYVDTRQLRQRLQTELFPEDARSPGWWSMYGNAQLLRGFAPTAMLELCGRENGSPRVVLDTECGAVPEGDVLRWHAFYDPTKPETTPMSDVFHLDCLYDPDYERLQTEK